MYTKINQLSNSLSQEVINIRRDFHSYPETGWLEMRTTAIIAKNLSELGYQVITGKELCKAEARMGIPTQQEIETHAQLVLTQNVPEEFLTEDIKQGFTGAIGILKCGEGPVVAMRFDIDALGLVETDSASHAPNHKGFASRNEGMMHACGHDGHAAIGLGVAKVLAEIKSQLKGTVKLIFQPGEEGARGAAAIVANGHLDDVDFFLGTHIAPDDSLDDGDITPGTYGSLATVKYDVTFKGEAAHAGGYPEKGKNALMAAATALLGLEAIPRHSGGISRVNVGVLKGGTSRNVIADTAVIEIEVRGETTEINEYMDKQAIQICNGAAAMYGCECQMLKMGQAEGQHSDVDFIEEICNICKEHIPNQTLSSCVNSQNWGSEDISIMMNRVQQKGGKATYMRSMTKVASPQHTVGFDFDEKVLPNAINVFSAVTYSILSK